MGRSMKSFRRFHISFWSSPINIDDGDVDTSGQGLKETHVSRVDDDNLVRNLTASGNACFASGKYKKALETYLAVIRIINPAMKVGVKGTESSFLSNLSEYLSFNALSIKTTKQTFHMAKVLVNIGAVLLKTDKIKGALRILQESLDLSRSLVETFGASHQMNMGKRIFRNSDDDLIQLNCLNLYADILQNMGLVYIKSSNYESAQDKFAQSIASRRSALKLAQECHKTQVSDEDDFTIPSCRYALAHLLQTYGWICDQRGLYDESKLSYCEALNLRYDDEAKTLIPLLAALADSYVKCHEWQDAHYSYELMMEMIKQEEYSTDLIDVTIKLSSLYQKEEKYPEALQYAQKAFITAADFNYEDKIQKSIALSAAMSNLGKLNLQKGFFVKAKKWFKASLEERLETLKLEDPLIMESIHSLASVYISRKCFSRSIAIYTKCIDKFIQVLGENHRSVAKLTDKLGEAYSNIEDYETAIELHSAARQLITAALGGIDNHLDVACILRSTAATYCKAGRMNEGFDIFSEALRIFHKCGYTNGHPDVAQTLQQIDTNFAENRSYTSDSSL